MKSITLAPNTTVSIALDTNERFEVLLSVGSLPRVANYLRYKIAYNWNVLKMQLNEDRLVGLSGACAGAYWRPAWNGVEVQSFQGVINRYEFTCAEAGMYSFAVAGFRALVI